MANNQKKGMLFGKINFIDVLIVLILAAGLVLFGFYAMGKWQANGSSSSSQADSGLQYTLELTQKEEDVLDQIQVGDIVREPRKGEIIGKVVAIEERKICEEQVENNEEGIYEWKVVPERYNQNVVIETGYTKSETGYKVNETEIKVGKAVTIKNKNYVTSGTIIAVNQVDGKE